MFVVVLCVGALVPISRAPTRRCRAPGCRRRSTTSADADTVPDAHAGADSHADRDAHPDTDDGLHDPDADADADPHARPHAGADRRADPAGGVAGEQGSGVERCAGRRLFPIVLRKCRGPFKSARFTVNGTRLKTRSIHGRLGTIIDLRKIAKKVIRIKIRAVRTVKVLHGKRVYHPCRKKRPHTIPPL